MKEMLFGMLRSKKIYEKAIIFIDTFPNNLFMPNALISVYRWDQKMKILRHIIMKI